jgi:serine/threonine protein kinase
MDGFGRYNLLCKLGQGGMGVLYLARQKTLKRFCALKVVHPHLSNDKTCAERFLHEARSAAAIGSHPNLVGIFDCDQHLGQYFIAMEFIEGMTLGELVRKHGGSLPLPMILFWMHQAAVGLEYLHSHRIVHRDIKPDNMMIDTEGTLKIMDFGLAKYHLEGDQSMTSTGAVMGSPKYMSPEQINDSKEVDERSDIYSLGMVLFQFITGKAPYNHSTATATLMAHLNESVPSIAADRPDLSAGQIEAMDALIASMTAKDREQRLASASVLVEEMKKHLERNPFDESATQFWASLDFQSRDVHSLLKREKIDPNLIDSELAFHPETRETQAAGEGAASRRIGPMMRMLIFGAVPLSCAGLLYFGVQWKEEDSKSNKQPMPAANLAAAAAMPEKNTLQPQQGALFVKTTPPGATVLFRARAVASPASFDQVPIGKYVLKISKEGYEEIEEQVEVVAGRFVEKDFKLARPAAIAAHAPIRASPQSVAMSNNQGNAPASKPTSPFNPIGKSEEELIKAWGLPLGRMELGGERRITFSQGTVTLADSKAIDFSPAAPSPAVNHAAEQSRLKRDQELARLDQKEVLKRLQEELAKMRRDYSERHDEAYAKLRRERSERLGSGMNYEESQALWRQLEESYGLNRIKKDIQLMEDEIREQKERIYN